jgi:hypothetical protein
MLPLLERNEPILKKVNNIPSNPKELLKKQEVIDNGCSSTTYY